MALDINAIRFLIRSFKQGISFERVLMFGRLNLDVFPEKIKAEFAKCHLPSEPLAEAFRKHSPEFAEPVFFGLGAKEVSSLDASDYQQATMVHDMNLPIPAALKNQFDVVYDGGSLEHVFNVTVALKNCMEMTRVGGRLFLHSPANNWFGHGFYQFSPEFFYRALSEANGFELERMIAHPVGPYGRWYQVADPKQVGGRIELITFYPVLLLIQAKKIREAEIFCRAPQQSDYVAAWGEKESAKTAKLDGWFQKHFPGMAHFFRAVRTGIRFYREHSFWNRKNFTRVKKR